MYTIYVKLDCLPGKTDMKAIAKDIVTSPILWEVFAAALCDPCIC